MIMFKFKKPFLTYATALAVILVAFFGYNAASGNINKGDVTTVENQTIYVTSAQVYDIGYDRLGQTGHFQYESDIDDSSDSVFVTLQSRINSNFSWTTVRIDTIAGDASTTFTLNTDLPQLRWSVVAQDTCTLDLGIKWETLGVLQQ